ncbi:asparagine synthase-related protein, partial [Bacillus siamensis]|nr:asparagine synthase-related protein [Bacillus siamensis]
HSTTLPTILRNFDRLSMAHGIEVRMPFMDWRLVTYTMALPETSKSADGMTKVVARQAMANLMPESIRTARRKVGFNSPMPE